MTQPTSEHPGKGKPRQPTFHPAPFVDSMIDLQKQALEYAAELNQVWTARAQSESKLVADLMTKLAGARSIPDAASAWQECLQRQIQLNAEDTRRLLEQNERFLRMSAEVFTNGGATLSS
ncbi:MAG TPA: phasin family protein [Xanthobacteraceae bacterium]|nr:phasin family protein [Xanthobacteraceae bacterium]